MKALGRETTVALESGALDRFGELLTAQWDMKLERSPTPIHKQVDEWIRAGIDAGAAGGKLVGAGDGGFLLFYAEEKTGVRDAMAALWVDRGEIRDRLPRRHRHRQRVMYPVAVLAGGLGLRLRELTGDAAAQGDGAGARTPVRGLASWRRSRRQA